jgi:hypothetical protein
VIGLVAVLVDHLHCAGLVVDRNLLDRPGELAQPSPGDAMAETRHHQGMSFGDNVVSRERLCSTALELTHDLDRFAVMSVVPVRQRVECRCIDENELHYFFFRRGLRCVP